MLIVLGTIVGELRSSSIVDFLGEELDVFVMGSDLMMLPRKSLQTRLLKGDRLALPRSLLMNECNTCATKDDIIQTEASLQDARTLATYFSFPCSKVPSSNLMTPYHQLFMSRYLTSQIHTRHEPT